MTQLFKPIYLLVVFSAFVLSCTEAPDNAEGVGIGPRAGKVTRGAGDKALSAAETQGPEGNSSEDLDDKKLENLVKPIVYGVGAAGITMDTTFKESKDLLTPPFRGPFADGLTFYNEQLVVFWKNDGDRKPALIVPLKSYLGTMKAGKFGDLDFQTKFTQYKGDDPFNGALRLTRELFNEFEKVEDKNYDCLTAGRCRLLYGNENQPNMVMVFPGAILLLAKEEFQIAEIRIRLYVDPGLLANNIDLLSGDFLVPNQKPVSFFDSNSDIMARVEEYNEINEIKTVPEISVATDSIYYLWSGVIAGFHRSNYVNDVSQSEETDANKFVQLSSEYPGYLTLGGKRIVLAQTLNDASFVLAEGVMPSFIQNDQEVDEVSVDSETVLSQLRMSTRVFRGTALKFSKNFISFLSAELGKEYDTINTFLFGYQNEKKAFKEHTGIIYAYNSSTLKGVSMSFEVSEEQQRMNFVTVGAIDSEINGFNKLILPASQRKVARLLVPQAVMNVQTNEPVFDPATGQPVVENRKEASFSTLGGMALNGLVKLRAEELDALGRQEATIEYMSSPELGPIVERSSYVEQGTFMEPEDNREKPRDQGFANVGVMGTVVGLKVIGGSPDGSQYARVVSISTGNLHAPISDVCGLGSDIQFEIGMSDSEVVAALAAAVEKKQALNPAYQCDSLSIRDKGELGRLKKIYFPSERLVLEFSDRALGSVSIYLPLNEVQTQLPEVSK